VESSRTNILDSNLTNGSSIWRAYFHLNSFLLNINKNILQCGGAGIGTVMVEVDSAPLFSGLSPLRVLGGESGESRHCDVYSHSVHWHSHTPFIGVHIHIYFGAVWMGLPNIYSSLCHSVLMFSCGAVVGWRRKVVSFKALSLSQITTPKGVNNNNKFNK
jgi:hypothetical protein